MVLANEGSELPSLLLETSRLLQVTLAYDQVDVIGSETVKV